MSYTYKDGDIVDYDYAGMIGHGMIVGVSVVELPTIGATYMVDDYSGNVPTETYPFRTIAIAEIFLKAKR